jgi:hypothetical protein
MYVTNKELLEELEISNEQNILTEKCIEYFVLICKKYVSTNIYYCKEDKEDAIHNAILILCTNWRKIDIVNYSNPFAYVTQIVKNSVRHSFKYKARHTYKHYNLDDMLSF